MAKANVYSDGMQRQRLINKFEVKITNSLYCKYCGQLHDLPTDANFCCIEIGTCAFCGHEGYTFSLSKQGIEKWFDEKSFEMIKKCDNKLKRSKKKV